MGLCEQAVSCRCFFGQRWSSWILAWPILKLCAFLVKSTGHAIPSPMASHNFQESFPRKVDQVWGSAMFFARNCSKLGVSKGQNRFLLDATSGGGRAPPQRQPVELQAHCGKSPAGSPTQFGLRFLLLLFRPCNATNQFWAARVSELECKCNMLCGKSVEKSNLGMLVKYHHSIHKLFWPSYAPPGLLVCCCGENTSLVFQTYPFRIP
jgi:hypothetical protein